MPSNHHALPDIPQSHPMYLDSIHTLGDQAAQKLTHQRNSILGHIVR